MKKRVILSLLTFSMLAALYGQPSFENDSAYRVHDEGTLKQVDSAFALEKDNDFEFKLWTVSTYVGEEYLFILALKDTIWKARMFTGGLRNGAGRFLTELNIPLTPVTEFLDGLNKNHYLSIPNHDKVFDKNGEPADVRVLDGVSYWFDLTNKAKKRYYFYHCPGIHAEQYPDIETFRQVINIIEAVYKYCGIKKYPHC